MAKTAHEFTTADRDRMRSAILHYMEEHDIGVPTLRERIAKATGRTRNVPSGKDPYTIDLKTFQRFLNDSHRTNDSFLVPLAQWLKDMPQPVDEIGAFAKSAQQFFASAGRASDDAPLGSGTLQVFRKPPVQKMRLREKDESAFALHHATMRVIRDGPENVFSVSEEVLVPDDDQEPPGENYRQMYEGVAVDLTVPLMIILRNAMTGYPKSCWLYRGRHGLYGFYSQRGLNEPQKEGFFGRYPLEIVLTQVEHSGERDDG